MGQMGVTLKEIELAVEDPIQTYPAGQPYPTERRILVRGRLRLVVTPSAWDPTCLLVVTVLWNRNQDWRAA